MEGERVEGLPRSGAGAQRGAGDPVVVVGAGPAGLTAAYQLVKAGHRPVVVEADDVVGGLSRTVERDGWRFDIGGHRFFTKVDAVEALWHEILPGDDFMVRSRASRIFYRGRYYDYPLRPVNALRNLGPKESVLCGLSYLRARLRPPADQADYESWLVARFGRRLYRTFFKTYTEKVWGVPVSEMPADWAAQRVKSLDLGKALVHALPFCRDREKITTLVEQFRYPRHGPGMMWERCRDLVVQGGGAVRIAAPVVAVHVGRRGAEAVSVALPGGGAERVACSHLVSSMPLRNLVEALDPSAPEPVRSAAAALAYRDFLTVALVVPEDRGFPDNWIYVHSPDVAVSRIQNYGSWSPHMVKPGRTCLGLEYFVFEGDELWSAADDEMVERGKQELGSLGLVDPGDVEAGYVVRVPKAYPHYDVGYRANVETIVRHLASVAPNVFPVGRSGMHRYNNQDHSMYTAMLSVENILGASHDVWAVNVEAEHLEALSERVGSRAAVGGRDVATPGGGLGGGARRSFGSRRDAPAAVPVPAAVGPGTGRGAPVLPRRPRRDDPGRR